MALRYKGGGVGISFNPDGSIVEVDTSTCKHCGRITDIPNRRKMMECVELCRACMGLICLRCAGQPCTPLMKKIEAREQEYYQREQLRKTMGA